MLRRLSDIFAQEEKASVMTSAKPQVSFSQFLDVDIRVGTIITVEDFPEARKPAWKLTCGFAAVIMLAFSSCPKFHLICLTSGIFVFLLSNWFLF